MFKLNIHKKIQTKIKPILKMDQKLVFYTGRGHVCIDLVPHRNDMFNANVYNIWPVTEDYYFYYIGYKYHGISFEHWKKLSELVQFYFSWE